MGRLDPHCPGTQPHNLEEKYVAMGVYLIDSTDTANRKSGKAVEEANTHMRVRKRQATFLGGQESFKWRMRHSAGAAGGGGLCDCGPRPARSGNSRSKGLGEGEEGFANN